MQGWDRYAFDKMHVGTCYAELVFLHPVGSAGHVMRSGGSGSRNVDAPFFMLRWDRYKSTKTAQEHVMPNLCFCIWWVTRVTKCILLHLGHETSTQYFSCSIRTGTNSTKRASGHVMPNLSFCFHLDLWVT
jgi:hypothetical protein